MPSSFVFASQEKKKKLLEVFPFFLFLFLSCKVREITEGNEKYVVLYLGYTR